MLVEIKVGLSMQRSPWQFDRSAAEATTGGDTSATTGTCT